MASDHAAMEWPPWQDRLMVDVGVAGNQYRLIFHLYHAPKTHLSLLLLLVQYGSQEQGRVWEVCQPG